MGTKELIREIKKLPLSKRILIVEEVIHSIRKTEERNQMSIAAESLAEEYNVDNDLNIFTNLDFEDFYEAK